MPAWCPWCAAEISPPSSADFRCPKCGGKVPPDTALSVPPATPMRPSDPEARLAPKPPEGGSPLPAGTPNPTPASLARWAVTIAIGAALLAALAWAVGRPALNQAPTPTPTARPSPSPVAT